MKNNLNLINMRDVPIEPVQWLWYPYIPIGKLTMVQGDPGDGKTTFVLAVIAALTKGEPLPECSGITEPMNVIYQTAEDGLSDTIKPRLVNTGADCSRVLVIDESHGELSLCDERLEQAIRETGAKLVSGQQGGHESCQRGTARHETHRVRCESHAVRGHSGWSHEQIAEPEGRLPQPRFR